MLQLFRNRGICKILLNNSEKYKNPTKLFHKCLSNCGESSNDVKKWVFLKIKSFDLTRTLRTTNITFSEDELSEEDSNQQKQKTIDPAKDRTKIIDPEVDNQKR
ncbi:28S ribosomal protein S18b [Nephila pilipes]|uniref:28S ribosomal protein S18b n=1 Tax=Nephila pilipes TaxID=299642 RepID=A0A8X6U8C4_NEPPI|nr:28S ribosomal protein S18b [Nephila pilipes]